MMADNLANVISFHLSNIVIAVPALYVVAKSLFPDFSEWLAAELTVTAYLSCPEFVCVRSAVFQAIYHADH